MRWGFGATILQRGRWRKRVCVATDRRRFLAIVGNTVVALFLPQLVYGRATQRRIGHLSAFPRADIEFLFGLLRPELERFGWVDGRNIVLLEPRTVEGRNERLPALAAEVVALSPDVILVQSAPATRAAMQATKSIPIVMIGVGNPLEYGIVADYAKPGGNVTGSTFLADESIRKLLELLKEAVPRLGSVAVFANPTNEAAAPMIKKLRADAAIHRITVQIVEVSSPADFELAFAAIRRDNMESLLLPPEPLIRSKREAIGEFAQRHGLLLAVVGQARYLPPGGLIAYSPAAAQYPQLTAWYIDQILKGARPGDLPIQQPTRFELVVNLRTAKTLGLKLPASILTGANEVIQ
jgi:putative ABC transport system substrate-binding protein